LFERCLRALVVGYGSIGKRHIHNLSSFPDLEIIVCTNQKYDKFLKKSKSRVFKSIEECIKEKPDVALITNVTSNHIKTAIKLANAGISLFIEKPLSNSLVGVKRLLDIVEEKKLVTLMGCNLRFHPCLKKIKEIISSNQIGRVISVHVENGSFLPDWHPYEDYRKSYASRKELGGGVVFTNIHEIDYLYWFFGDVKEVCSMVGKISDLELSVDDIASILMRFRKNIIAEVHLDYFQRPSFRGCKIIGTKGTVYWDSETNDVKMYDVNKKKWSVKLKLRNYDNNSMYVEEISHFLKSVIKKKKTINSIHDGVKMLKIALAIQKSSKVKKTVPVE